MLTLFNDSEIRLKNACIYKNARTTNIDIIDIFYADKTSSTRIEFTETTYEVSISNINPKVSHGCDENEMNLIQDSSRANAIVEQL